VREPEEPVFYQSVMLTPTTPPIAKKTANHRHNDKHNENGKAANNQDKKEPIQRKRETIRHNLYPFDT
jgi:hypothetical protein